MGNLTAFLAQNARQVENVKLVVSDRFTDEDGKPLEWEVRCISSREDETLRRDCQYRVQVPGKRGASVRNSTTCCTLPNWQPLARFIRTSTMQNCRTATA